MERAITITIDRRGSRRLEGDDVDAARRALERDWGARLRSPVARFAGDELQLTTVDATAAIDIALALTRSERWSVGIGVGEAAIDDDPAASTGPAFFSAREAVDRAKRSPGHVAVRSERDVDGARDVEAVLALLVDLRSRRSDAGWEVADLLADGTTQRAAAERLGVTPSAVSARAAAAGLRVESAATATVERMLARLLEAHDA